jgi:beta-lactamase regulating signal transducer with metallopeptidase domain
MNLPTYLSTFELAGPALSRYWIAAGWTMLHFVWLGTLIGLAAWAIRRVLRPLGPQVCYVALVLLLFAMSAGVLRLYGWVLASTPAPADAVPIAIAPALPAAVEQPIASAPQATVSAPAPVITPADALRQEAIKWLGNVARLAPWVWLFGTPGTLLFLALGLAGTERLRRQSRLLVTGEIAETARRLAVAMRVSRNVSVAVCDRVVAPMLLGVLRPLIVLPPAVLAGHSALQIEMILLHELAHVRRWDNLVNLAQRVVEAVLFFHPAVWIVSRWVRLEREHCCDQVVLAHTGDPQTYAETLAALAIPGLAPAHAAAAMANHQLVTRIRQILNLEERSMTLPAKTLSLAAGLLLTAGLIVAAYAQSQPTGPESSDKPDFPAMTTRNSVDPQVLHGVTQHLGDQKLDDATFYRRIRLDLTGTPPTVTELKAFLADSSANKRAKLVESLLTDDKSNQKHAGFVRQLLAAQNTRDSLILAAEPDSGTAATATANKRPYSAQQLTGPPDSAMGGDSQSAWCSLTADDHEEWLELEYAQPVWTVAVLVYANCSPGAVSQVQVHSAEQPGLSFTWADRDPTAKTATHGISVIPLTSQMKTKRIKITLDSKNTPGWNEIDAVGLLDGQGKVHWAASAKASSTYADAPPRDSSRPSFQTTAEGDIVRFLPLVGRTVKSGDTLTILLDSIGPQKAPYSAEQATGPPDAPSGKLSDRAWSPRGDDPNASLKVRFEKPVRPVAVLIYESANPGAIQSAHCLGFLDKHTASLRPEPASGRKSRILTWSDFDANQEIFAVELKVKSATAEGPCQIDAVALLDDKGQLQWANSATASSRYDETRPKANSTRFDDTKANASGIMALAEAIDKPASTSEPQTCFVILEGAAAGGQDRIVPYTLSGNETVLDVVAKIAPDTKLNARRVRILRPGKGQDAVDQILHVNHDAIRQGNTKTNHRVLSGDRVFVDAGAAQSGSSVRRGGQNLAQSQQTPQDALELWFSAGQQAAEAQRQKALADEQAAKAAVEKSHADAKAMTKAANKQVEATNKRLLDDVARRLAAEAADAERRDKTRNSDQGQIGSANWNVFERQRLIAEAERAAAQLDLAKAESQKLQDMLSRQEKLIKDLQDIERVGSPRDPQSKTVPPAVTLEKAASDARAAELRAMQAEEMLKMSMKPAAIKQEVQKTLMADRDYQKLASDLETLLATKRDEQKSGTQNPQTDALIRQYEQSLKALEQVTIQRVRESVQKNNNPASPLETRADRPEKEFARVTIKAPLGQSATAAFADGVRFNRVAVDGEEIAFAAIAKPNEVIVCGKRTGTAKVRAYDENGRLYLVNVEFVAPPPSRQ